MLESNTNFVVVAILSLLFIATLILLIIYGDRFKKCPEPNCTSQCATFNPTSSYSVSVSTSTDTYSLIQFVFSNSSATWGQLGIIDTNFTSTPPPVVQNGWNIVCQKINNQLYIGFMTVVASQLYSMWVSPEPSTTSSSATAALATNEPGQPPVDPTYVSWFLAQPDPSNPGNYLLFNKGQQLVIETSNFQNNDSLNAAVTTLFTTSSPTSTQFGSFSIVAI